MQAEPRVGMLYGRQEWPVPYKQDVFISLLAILIAHQVAIRPYQHQICTGP